ncbi:MAG: glycosyltransferase [Gammaproteobacteria bacterium]|nr:glycosyltransferase [Gammaproteobacteria bacterium]
MTSKRRVLILTPSLGGGGAERVTLLLASGLLDRGHAVDILVRDLVCDYPQEVPCGIRLFFLSPGVSTECRANLEQLPITPQPLIPTSFHFPRLVLGASTSRNQWSLLMSKNLPRWAIGIAAYIDRECPDALLAMMTPAVASATLAVRLAQYQVRMTVGVQHNIFTSKRETHRARKSYPYADAAVGVSSGVTAELAKLPGMSSDQLHTIYNPVVSKDLLQKASETPDHPWFNEPGPPIILAVGRLHEQKDFPTLLAAFAQLLTRRPARLIILGEGSLRPNLLSLAHNLQVSEHVDFPGFVENPFAYLAKARLFVLSSLYEGLPTVLIEAMACGCPVVSTDCPHGPDEILENGQWGELVPVDNSEVLSAAMIRAIDKPVQRDALRERAAFFNVERAVDSYEDLLLG